MDKRRKFLKKTALGLVTFSTVEVPGLTPFKGRSKKEEVFFTTGFKVAEITLDSVIIWTRLCSQEYPNPIVHERREKVFRHPIDFDEDQSVEQMDGAVKGGPGQVRIKIKAKGQEQESGWMEAVQSNDFIVSKDFQNLQPDTIYQVVLEGRTSKKGVSSLTYGSFKTAPKSDQNKDVLLVTSTCQYFWSFDDKDRGFKSYDSMRRMEPDFFIQTGDYVYYDKPGPLAKDLAKARHKWHAMDSRPAIRDLYAKCPVFLMKDDHDLLKNDVYPGMDNYGDLSYKEGLDLWYKNAPITSKPYRRIRWGKNLEIWLVEGREYRSANTMEDGPGKSIWGEEQKNWFVKTVEESDATFKILFTATPVVGPDRKNKSDNHANSTFETEGDWLRKYLSGLDGMFVVNGDRHWQYVSEDSETGLLEFGSGPVSDYHAQGWTPGDVRPEHRFLRVKGGFLSIGVKSENDKHTIVFQHRDVNGDVVHEEIFESEV